MRIKFEKMNRLKILNLVLLVLLAFAAGSAKVSKLPEELAFFQQFGFSDMVLVIFWVLQILAGVLMIFIQFRLVGLVILAITFLLSSFMIFFAGQIGFGIFSLLPLLMILFGYKYPINKTSPVEQTTTEA